MADIAKRMGQNPILKPADIRPSIPGMTVESLLNPGAFRFHDKTWLLLRVAERLEARPHALIVSGLLDSEADEVAASFAPLTVRRRLSMKGWTALLMD
jgi:predicted GH43/DUF377 family glycosyl hydrolase